VGLVEPSLQTGGDKQYTGMADVTTNIQFVVEIQVQTQSWCHYS
jgi:hypothetical protein